MLRRIPLVWLALLVLAPLSFAQEMKDKDDELAFVQRLRDRHYADLALEYLEKRLSKDPKYAVDLPLEIAQTKLEMARTESDAGKRINLFDQVRSDLVAFVAKNPTHPRIAIAKLQIAQVAAEQGKTQFSHALALPEGDDTRKAELNHAEQLLDSAVKGFELMAEQLSTPEAKNKSAFERGVMLTLLGKVLLELKKETKAGEAFKGAVTLFDGLAENLDNKDPLRPLSLAWCGRAFSLNAEPAKAKPKWTEARQTNDRTAIRLADYFEMVQEFEKETARTDADRTNIVRGAFAWHTKYPGFRNTPEGFHVQYVLAKMYVDAGAKTTGPTRKTNWDQAKVYLRNLEQTDNDYSSLAQQLKVEILFQEGAFSGDYTKLIPFDSVYMRALYEHQQLNRNEKDKFDTPEKKKKQQELIVEILKLALKKADGKKVSEVDLSNAYYLLTGYYLTTKNYAEAARVGREFAEKHPKAKQAPTCAMFAAQALSDQIRQGGGEDWGEKMKDERKMLFDMGEFMANRWPGDKAGEYGRYLVVTYLIKEPLQSQTDEEKKAEQQAREDRAFKIGGDVARFQLGSQRAKESKFYDSVVLLREIKPGYANYALSQYQLALSALKVQEENEGKKKAKDPKDPPRLLPNDKREFRDIAIEALEKIPDPAGSEADALLYYLRAKIRLGLLHYSLKKYDDMVALVTKLQPIVEKLKGGAADMERANFQMQLNAIKLSAVYGKAFDASAAGKHEEVLTLLDPVVKELKEGKYPEAKDNQPMLSGLMGMALRSNLQLERGEKARAVFDTWNALEKERIQAKAKVESEKLEAGIADLEKKPEKSDDDKKLIEQQKGQLATLKGQLTEPGLAEALSQHRASVLQQTFAVLHKQIEELRKKGDKEKLNRLINSFSSLLTAEKSDDKNMKPDVRFLVGQCYSSIGRYQQAIDLLKAYPAPPPNATPQDQARYKVARVLLIHTYRLNARENKDAKSFEDATKILDEAMQPTEEDKKKKQAGWGKRDINALKEEIQLLMDREAVLGEKEAAWGAAVNRCNELLKILAPKLKEGGVMRDHYFEVGSFFVRARTMYGLEPKNAAKREQSLNSAANFYSKLLTNFPDLGGPESKARYVDFINSPEGAELKKVIDQLMPPK